MRKHCKNHHNLQFFSSNPYKAYIAYKKSEPKTQSHKVTKSQNSKYIINRGRFFTPNEK